MAGKLSSFQSRLAMKQDSFKRKVIDRSNIFLISSPVDCFLLKAKKTYEGDDISWIVKGVDVIPCVFPALEDVPFRKVQVDENTLEWSLTSLIDASEDGQQDKMYTLQVPYEAKVDVGDLIIRVFLDEAQKVNAIVPMQVQEPLGTFGGMKLIMQKFACTIPTDNFPPEIIECIREMSMRRSAIAY
jgi:hypothetical protein